MMSLIFRKKLIRLKPPLQIVRLPSFDPEKNIFGSVGTKIQGGGFKLRKNQIQINLQIIHVYVSDLN